MERIDDEPKGADTLKHEKEKQAKSKPDPFANG